MIDNEEEIPMKKFLYVLLSVIVLSACNDDSSPAKEEAPEEAVKPESTPVVTESKPIVQSTTTYDEDEIVAYNIESTKILEVMNASMDKITELLTDASSDPTLMMNEEWMTDIALALTIMDQSIDQIRSLEPPPLMEESHQYLMMGLDEYDFMIQNFPRAIDNYDLDLMNQCAEAMFVGSDYLEQASQLNFEIVNSLEENDLNENVNVSNEENNLNENVNAHSDSNEAVEPEQSNQTLEKLYRIQAGAFSSEENALALENDIKNSGIEAAVVEKEGLYIVYVGAFKIKDNADKRLAELQSYGFEGYMKYE